MAHLRGSSLRTEAVCSVSFLPSFLPVHSLTVFDQRFIYTSTIYLSSRKASVLDCFILVGALLLFFLSCYWFVKIHPGVCLFGKEYTFSSEGTPSNPSGVVIHDPFGFSVPFFLTSSPLT